LQRSNRKTQVEAREISMPQIMKTNWVGSGRAPALW
jgi:hypothetical protein